MIGPHEVAVRVEEDADVPVAQREPDGQHGRLQPRPQTEFGRGRLVLVPNEETEVVATLHSATLFALGRTRESCKERFARDEMFHVTNKVRRTY